jgi:hypothetical protein
MMTLVMRETGLCYVELSGARAGRLSFWFIIEDFVIGTKKY